MSETRGDSGTLVYIGNFELPDGNAAAQRVRGNARIFRDLGYRVLLVGVSRAMAAGCAIERCDCGEDGIEGWQVPYPKGMRDWLSHTVSPRVLDEVLAEARIADLAMVICYNTPAVAQYRMARRARALGALAIADITEWYGRVANDSVAGVVKNIDTPLRMHHVNPRMDGLITCSPFVSDLYRDTGLPVVELPTIQPLSDEVELPAAEDRDYKQLFFAGTGFDPAIAAKGKDGLKDRLDWVLELLGAAKQQGSRFRMDLYGVTEADYLALVPAHGELVAELGDWVSFHGRVPHAQLLDRLKAADFSVFMRKETRVTMAGFPTKFSESVTYGTPVICTYSPSLVPYMEEGRTGFSLDAEDMAGAARKLASILDLPAGDVRAMKRYCVASGMFGYRTFVAPVQAWLEQLQARSGTKGRA